MKNLFAATVALSLLGATAAMAAPNDQRPGNQNQGYQNQHSQDYGRPKPASKPQYTYNGRKYDAVRGPAWNAPKGYDARREWKYGQKLPANFRDRGYYVDYRTYHLKQPPRGYQWVRVNNNVYLVSERSGLITQIVLNLFY